MSFAFERRKTNEEERKKERKEEISRDFNLREKVEGDLFVFLMISIYKIILINEIRLIFVVFFLFLFFFLFAKNYDKFDWLLHKVRCAALLKELKKNAKCWTTNRLG